MLSWPSSSFTAMSDTPRMAEVARERARRAAARAGSRQISGRSRSSGVEEVTTGAGEAVRTEVHAH